MKNLDEMIQYGRDVQARREREFAEAEMRRQSKMKVIKEWAGPDVTIQADRYMQNIALIRGDKAVTISLTWGDVSGKFNIHQPATKYKINFFDSERPSVKYLGDEQAEVALAWLFEKE